MSKYYVVNKVALDSLLEAVVLGKSSSLGLSSLECDAVVDDWDNLRGKGPVDLGDHLDQLLVDHDRGMEPVRAAEQVASPACMEAVELRLAVFRDSMNPASDTAEESLFRRYPGIKVLIDQVRADCKRLYK